MVFEITAPDGVSTGDEGSFNAHVCVHIVLFLYLDFRNADREFELFVFCPPAGLIGAEWRIAEKMFGVSWFF